MDSCKCYNRSDYIETCCFNPVIFFICKLCRGTFENAEKLILHKRQQHSLKDLKGIKFIIFEERFIEAEESRFQNELTSNLVEHECEIPNKSTDIDIRLDPHLHATDSAADTVTNIFDESEKAKLPNPYVYLRRLTSKEITNYSIPKAATTHDQDGAGFNVADDDKKFDSAAKQNKLCHKPTSAIGRKSINNIRNPGLNESASADLTESQISNIELKSDGRSSRTATTDNNIESTVPSHPTVAFTNAHQPSNTLPNESASTLPELRYEISDNSSDINSVVSPLHQDDSLPDACTDIVIDITDDSEKIKLPYPCVYIKRLRSTEINSYAKTRHSHKNQENEDSIATKPGELLSNNGIKNNLLERELLDVIPEAELTRTNTKKSNDADAKPLELSFNEAIHDNDIDYPKTEKQSDFDDLDSFALITKIDSNDAPNSPVPGPVTALPIPSITETETKAKDQSSDKNYNSEVAVPPVQVATPKIRDSSQTETLPRVSPPTIAGGRPTRSLRSRSKINYSENQTCAKCNRDFPTVEKLAAHQKVCIRYKTNRAQEKSRKRDLLQTTLISDKAARTTQDDSSNEILIIQETAISPNPIDLEIKVTDGEGDQVTRPGPVVNSIRGSNFESIIIRRDALQNLATETEKSKNYADCPLSLQDWIRKEEDKNPENIILLDPDPFQEEADTNKKVGTPAYVATPENPIKCKLCSMLLTSDLDAKRHLKCCWTKNIWKHVHCPMCSKSYSTPSGLYRHRKVKHLKPGEKPLSFKCTICSKELATKLGFNHHMEVHKNPNLKPFVCEICGSGFRYKYKLQYHQVSHSEDRPFKCKLCPKTFKNKQVLRRHGSFHVKNNNYHCQPCNKSFKTSEVLRRHKSYHLKDKWHPCTAEHCDLKFPFKPLLWSHCRNDHRELFLQMAKFCCTVCSKKFMINSKLERHMFSHGRERPFKCSEEGCNGTFTTKQSFEEHCRKHTGERPYQCEQCGSTFARSTLFHIHLKEHKSPKVRVLCHLCPKTFSRNWELQQHLIFHEKGKQFKCDTCGFKSMTKANLKGHMKTHERKGATDDVSSSSSSSESEVESEEETTQESEPESE